MLIKVLLEEKYNSVYLDKVCDPDLSFNKISGETAKRLQLRLNKSKELYFVISKNSKKSAWMPWELGCFDGLDDKRASLIKIYPIIDKDEEEIMEFEGQEYLELYHLVEDENRDKYAAIKLNYLIEKYINIVKKNKYLQ